MWQIPVAMISTSTSSCPGTVEIEFDDLERLLGCECDGGTGLHLSVLLVATNGWGPRIGPSLIKEIQRMDDPKKGDKVEWSSPWRHRRTVLSKKQD